MSIVFVKSEDKTAESGRGNPNKPYRFSNYFTQPMKLPPNSQVAYVGSTFNMNPNGRVQTEPYYFMTGIAELNYPIAIYSEQEGVSNWAELLNNHAGLVNQYGVEGDYMGAKTRQITDGRITQTCSTTGACFTYRNTEKGDWEMVSRDGYGDTFNMDFNCNRANPAYAFGGFGGGGMYPAGINWNYDLIDTQYTQEAVRYSSGDSPNGQVLSGGNAGGMEVNVRTTDQNTRNLVYQAQANYYNVGMGYRGLNGNLTYNWFQNAWDGSAFRKLPSFNSGSYATVYYSGTGIRKCVGNLRPSTDSQISNTGGHQYIGHLGSGGYGIWTMSNLAYGRASQRYTTDFYSTTAGFTGLCGGTSVGVIPQAWVRNEDNTYNTAVINYNRNLDLNVSTDPTGNTAVGAKARYLFGFDIYEDYSGGQGNADLKIQAKVLDWESGSLENSKYRDVGNALSITKLSQGINTATTPEYEFDTAHTHYINTYNSPSGGGNKASMIFFRFRWTSPYQMALEYTLQEEGKATSYNPYHDEPYAPSTPVPAGVEIPTTSQDILLNETTNGTTVPITTNTRFRDSGADSPYAPNENYTITFEAPAGATASFTLTSFGFEHSTGAMYDRLAIQGSNDNATYVNLELAGFQKSAIDTPPYGNSFAGATYSSSQSINGWILSKDPARFVEIGGDPNAQINTQYRYLRFSFVSDFGTQDAGWDIQMTAQSGTPGVESDPTDKWVLLANMDIDNDKHVLIPSYFGDMCLASYTSIGDRSTTREHFQHATKGYFDLREGNRYFREQVAGGYASGSYTDPVIDYKFFNNGGMGNETLCIINDSDANLSTPKLKLVPFGDVETFDANGFMTKRAKMLVNTIESDDQTQKYDFKDVKGEPLFNNNEPQPLLEMGYILGLTKQGENESVVDLTFKSGQTNIVQNKASVVKVQSSSLAFSNHIQLSNLPIQSQNGVVSSQNKTIYVINSLCVGKYQDGENYRFYCDTSPQLLWIDLNNIGELNLNRLEVLITNDENVPQQLLTDNTDITLMFREKPSRDTGYYPNNIATQPLRVSL